MVDAQGPRKQKDELGPLTRLIHSQRGVVSDKQLTALGMPVRSISRRVAAGELERILPRAYVVPTVPPCWEQRVIAALLWAGDDAAASHLTAAALLGLTERKPGVIEVSTTRKSRSPAPWLRVHHCESWARGERRRTRGLWVTTPEHTLLQLGATISTNALEEALECAIRSGLTTFERVHAHLHRNSRPGRRGCKSLRMLLETRGRRAATESAFETKLAALLRKARLPLSELQYEVSHQGRFVGRVDFAYPEAKVAIEADGWAHHFGRQAWQRDSRRGNDLLTAGWKVLRFTYEDLEQRPDEVVTKIREALDATLF